MKAEPLMHTHHFKLERMKELMFTNATTTLGLSVAYDIAIITNTVHQGLNFKQFEAILGHKVRLPGTLFSHIEPASTLPEADDMLVHKFTDHVQSIPAFHTLRNRDVQNLKIFQTVPTCTYVVIE